MPYVTHQTSLISEHYIDDDMNLCHLLQTMKLDRDGAVVSKHGNITAADTIGHISMPNAENEVMEEDRTFQLDTISEKSSASKIQDSELPPCGCAYLRAIRHQLEWGAYPTTGGEYLDVIFTHREILFSHQAAHQDCARAFSDLAGLLENRAWRSDRDADPEAVAAFRHEAMVIALTQ